MLKKLTTKNGLYVTAFGIGTSVYLVDLFLLTILSPLFPNFAQWADEIFLLFAIVGLAAYVWFKYAGKVQAVVLPILVYLGYTFIPSAMVMMTMETIKAKITTAGLDESQKGKQAVWRASVKPVDSNEESSLYVAQDARFIWPILWYARSADTRVKLEEFKNTQETVCVKAYGIRVGLFSLFPNIVSVKKETEC